MTSAAILENEELIFSILNFCDEATRFNFVFLSTKQCKLLTSEVSFKWRVECLHRERGIYHPLNYVPSSSCTPITTTKTAPAGPSWKEIFLCNYNRKNLWLNNNQTNNDQEENKMNTKHFHIKVSARFRPKNDNKNEKFNQYHHEKKIALPLYQRLALIQMNRNLQSKKVAFEVLVQQGGWFGNDNEIQPDSKESDTRDDDSNSNAGKGISKPPSLRGGVHLIDSKQNFAVLVDPTKGLRKFDFDNVFHDLSSQASVYSATTKPLITEFMNGFNVSCIVYGQTGR